MSFGVSSPLDLRDVKSLGEHAACVDAEQANHRVELKDSSSSICSQWQHLLNPALRNPVGHERTNGETSGNGETFEVLRLAGRVLGHISRGDVEACQSSQTREHEASQQQLIETRADTETEGTSSGCYAE